MKLLVSVIFEGLHIVSASALTLGLMHRNNTLICNSIIQTNEMGSGLIQRIEDSIDAFADAKADFQV